MTFYLTAYSLAVAPNQSLTSFVLPQAVITMIMSIYNILALTKAHKAYNYWAVLAFEIFLWIFWLVAFAWMAAWAAIYLGYWASYGYYYDSYYGDGYGDIYKTVGSVMGGAAGIGALTWILYFITLVMHSVFMTRHRAVGLGNRPGPIQTTAVGGGAAGVVPGAGEKVEMQPQQPGQVYPQNTGFSQQSTMYGAPPPHQQQQQQQQPGYYPPQQYQQQQQQQYAPQQYPDHSAQQQQQQQPAYSVSAPSGDGSYQHVPAQTTGGSYVQGNPVAFPNSHGSTDQLRQQSPPPQQAGPVHEAHGQSYDPHAPKEMQ